MQIPEPAAHLRWALEAVFPAKSFQILIPHQHIVRQTPRSASAFRQREDPAFKDRHWDCRERPKKNKHSFTKETLHEFPKSLKAKYCKVGWWSRRDMWTVSMARLCLLVYGVLVVGRFRAAVSESDVTPRLNFSYSKCRRLETIKLPELALAYVHCVGVFSPVRPHAVFREHDVSCRRAPGSSQAFVWPINKHSWTWHNGS